MVPSWSSGSLKSLNFTAAFISSMSVTVPCVASRSPSSISPRPRRSKAIRIPSPCFASSIPCLTASPISIAKPVAMPAAFVIKLPPNTCNMPSSLPPENKPPPLDSGILTFPASPRLLLKSSTCCFACENFCFSESMVCK